jgi:hypothetical protein
MRGPAFLMREIFFVFFFSLLSVCSHCVPRVFKLFPQHVPNSISVLSRFGLLAPKLDSLVHKLKRRDIQEHIFVSILSLRVQRDAPIGECPWCCKKNFLVLGQSNVAPLNSWHIASSQAMDKGSIMHIISD